MNTSSTVCIWKVDGGAGIVVGEEAEHVDEEDLSCLLGGDPSRHTDWGYA